jgi:hypothetical protein
MESRGWMAGVRRRHIAGLSKRAVVHESTLHNGILFSLFNPLSILLFHGSAPEGHCHSDGKRVPPMRKRRRFAVPFEFVGPDPRAWKCDVMYRHEELMTTRGARPMRGKSEKSFSAASKVDCRTMI